MSKNKKGAAAKGKAQNAADDDDWDSILAAEQAINAANAPVVAAPEPEPVKEAAESDDDDDEEDGEEGAAGAAKKDKKKKKKKGKAAKEAAKEEKKPATTTAAGRAILERQRLIAEEEARLKKLREEEEARIKAEEEREEAERRAIEEEKERKRKAKADKLEAQKAAGTYQTKAEKEKAKKAQARLEALKASGVNVAGLKEEASGETAAQPTRVVYSNKKKPTGNAAAKEDAAAKAAEAAKAEAAAAAAAANVPDSWDDEEGEDDWESNLTNIVGKIEAAKIEVGNDVEDQLEVDAKNNQEELKRLGLERARREAEEKARREEEERAREEMERHEREAAIRKETSRRNRDARDAAARAARSASNLRSPISCIMGHVDTGKTKLLDKIRHTNVQEGEAGGITQQIGATQFSRETLMNQTASMQKLSPFPVNIPGLLVIDTPGHESFTNLRSRGSSLCDIAILVVDLMHGLEQQTRESIKLLRSKNTPFIVALNKVDRCYGWKTMPDSPIQVALAAQDENTRMEFKSRYEEAKLQLNEEGLNVALYWENNSLDDTVSVVPTSAVSGEGVPDLLKNLITLTQDRLTEKLMYMELLQCTVLEVKVIEGLGHTVDVVLVNGTLREGDTIVVSTLDGPVVTNVRALLTPPPNREMRIKSEYVHHEKLSGAIGIKIVAPDIARAIAGTPVMVVHPEDDLEDVKEDVQSDLAKVMKSLETDQKGVTVHASTLGALEALLQFLRNECKPPIPVASIAIGPVHKRDIMKTGIMHLKKLPEFATILAFDVPVDSEATEFNEELKENEKVKIFTAEIIYHLFDQFTAYMNSFTEQRKAAALEVVAFPCILKILPRYIFNKKDPIVIGVEVLEGTLRLNTLLCIAPGPGNPTGLDVGRVVKIENNHKEVTIAKKGTEVSIQIVNESNPTITYGRQFDDKQSLLSKINRQAIDALKEFFKDEMKEDDWRTVIKLKKLLGIS